jgi:hypothetical protein
MAPRVDIQVSETADWIPVPDKKALPTRFWARIDDPDVPYVLRAEVVVTAGTPGIRQLVVHQREDEYPPGPSVSSLRNVRVRDCLRLAVESAATPRNDLRNERWPGAFTVPATGNQLWGRLPSSAGRQDDDRLDVVARAYRSAKSAGRPVREAVMAACNVQQSQAARLIRVAREAGKIPPRDTGGPAVRDVWEMRAAGGEVIVSPPRSPQQPGVPDAEPRPLPRRVVNLSKGTVRVEPAEEG